MMKPKPPTETDSIESLRDAMIKRRNEAMKNWPEGINDSVLFSHVIAILAYAKELENYVQST